MIFIQQLMILALFGFMGHILSLIIPLPGLILGMLLLFLFLKQEWLPKDSVELISTQLVGVSGLLFIPMIVGILEYWQEVKEVLLSFLMVVVLGTVVPLITTSVVLEWLINKQDEREAKRLKIHDKEDTPYGKN